MTRQATRGWSAMASAWRMPRGVSIMHQTGRPAGAPAASRTAQARRTASADFDLGQQDGARTRRGHGREVGVAPGRVQAVDPDHELAAAVSRLGGQRVPDRVPTLRLGVGDDRVLEVEDQRVGRELATLLERPRVRARHVEDAAAGADGCLHRRVSSERSHALSRSSPGPVMSAGTGPGPASQTLLRPACRACRPWRPAPRPGGSRRCRSACRRARPRPFPRFGGLLHGFENAPPAHLGFGRG